MPLDNFVSLEYFNSVEWKCQRRYEFGASFHKLKRMKQVTDAGSQRGFEPWNLTCFRRNSDIALALNQGSRSKGKVGLENRGIPNLTENPGEASPMEDNVLLTLVEDVADWDWVGSYEKDICLRKKLKRASETGEQVDG